MLTLEQQTAFVEEAPEIFLPIPGGWGKMAGGGPAQTVALEEEAIPHTAMSKCTSHFFLVNTLGESEFDSACFIERFQMFGGKLEIQTGEIALELRYLPRSNDRDY